MKRSFITILALFYFSLSSGAGLQLHYCIGKLAGWSISTGKDDDCSKCGMKKDTADDCCKDQYTQFKVSDGKGSKYDHSFKPVPVAELHLIPGRDVPVTYTSWQTNYVFLPFRTETVPAFIKYRNLRI